MRSMNSWRLAAAVMLFASWSAAQASSNGLVVSQVYGGGGNAGATYRNDFIEVFNAGTAAVSLSGYSVQYAATTGTSWQVTTLGAVNLAPGQYYLVQEAVGAGGTAALPTPDATGTINMSATAGKVALVSSTTALTGATPSGTQIIDVVGFGTGTNYFEGSGPTPAPSNTTAVLRAANGCTDTNNNAGDFATGAPNPRNTANAASSCGPATQPSVSLTVAPASFAENGGSATVTATLSSASGSAVTVNLAFAGTATNAADYTPSASSISIPAGGTSGTIMLTAINDSTYEGDETVVVSISGTPTGATVGTPNSVTVTITDDDPAPPPTIGARIYQIQGKSHVSPMNGMNVSNVPGIVTALASNGFYMQDADGDGDPATSDGILVFTSTAPTVAVGQQVLVSGKVTEFRPSSLATNLSTTEIDTPTITNAANLFTATTITPTVIGSGGRVPPTEIIDNDSNGNVETSATTQFDPAQDGIDFYESLEGMLVRVNNPIVTDRALAADRTIWVVGDNGSAATGRNARGGVTLVERAAGVDYNPEHIQLFTGLPGTNPASGAQFNVGDALASVNGVVSYFGGSYEILPTTAPAVTTPAPTARGVSSIATGGNRLSVGAYNVENLTVGDAQAKFDGLAADIVTAMGAPDIVSISEVQDNDGATNGTVACDQTMAKLIAAIQAKAGSAYNYQYRQIDPVANQDGGAPNGNIRVVQLFNANRVAFDDRVGGTSANSVAVTADANGKPVVNFSPGRIDPTNRAWANGNVAQPDGSTANYSGSRKPLVGEYTFNGRRVLVVSNHFNSRIGDDPLFGVNQPPRLLNEPQRREQALLVHNFVRSVVTIDPLARVVVLGDFNEYDFGNPLRILRNGPLTASGGDGNEPVLKNLSTQLVADPAERYSYVFDGNSQELDHILVSSALLDGSTQYQAVHLNAGYATQNSDHDPLVSSYLVVANLPPTASAGAPQTVTAGARVTLTGTASDADGRIVRTAWTQTAGPAVTLSGADTLTASFTAPATAANLAFQLAVTDNDGATTNATTTVTIPVDTTPDDFAFAPANDAVPGSTQTSAAITVSGVNSATPVAVSGGSYSVNGGVFTTAAGSVQAGDSLRVQGVAGSDSSDQRTVTLNLGGKSAGFVITTAFSGDTDGGGAMNPLALLAVLLIARRRRLHR